MKRARTSRDTLTGGTGDVNPQIFTVRGVQPTPDSAATFAFPVPVPRYGATKTKATVMEILRVDWILDDVSIATGATSCTYSASLATSSPDMSSSSSLLADPKAFAYFNIDIVVATLTGIGVSSRAKSDRLDDGAGHGLLVATDQIWLGFTTNQSGRANTVTAKITYRMKDVALVEYIGMVQSQQ